MKIGQWILPLSTLIFGLALGSLWSPRTKSPSSEELAKAASLHSTKSNNHSSSNPSSISSTASRSQRNGRHSTPNKELTPENLIQAFGAIHDEEKINPMEFARYGTQLSQLNEFEAKALLIELKGPFDEDQEKEAEVAQFASIVIFSRLCELNGPEAMKMLHDGELDDDLIDDLSSIGMNAWVAADPEGASHWFNGALSKLDQIIAEGGDSENIQDPAASLIVDSDMFESYMREMTTLDPEGLKNSITQYQSDEVKETLQESLAEHLVENLNSKEEIISVLNDNTFAHYEHGKIDLVQKLSESNPREAASYVEAQAPSATRDAMMLRVANALFQEKPAEGAAWYQKQELSPETLEFERLQHITTHWMYSDLEGAATWLLEQPNDNQRDRSEALLANRSAQTKEWEAAFRWSADISNTSTQQESIQNLLNQAWNRRENTLDPDAVQAARQAGYGQIVDDYVKAKTADDGPSQR